MTANFPAYPADVAAIRETCLQFVARHDRLYPGGSYFSDVFTFFRRIGSFSFYPFATAKFVSCIIRGGNDSPEKGNAMKEAAPECPSGVVASRAPRRVAQNRKTAEVQVEKISPDIADDIVSRSVRRPRCRVGGSALELPLRRSEILSGRERHQMRRLRFAGICVYLSRNFRTGAGRRQRTMREVRRLAGKAVLRVRHTRSG